MRPTRESFPLSRAYFIVKDFNFKLINLKDKEIMLYLDILEIIITEDRHNSIMTHIASKDTMRVLKKKLLNCTETLKNKIANTLGVACNTFSAAAAKPIRELVQEAKIELPDLPTVESKALYQEIHREQQVEKAKIPKMAESNLSLIMNDNVSQMSKNTTQKIVLSSFKESSRKPSREKSAGRSNPIQFKQYEMISFDKKSIYVEGSASPKRVAAHRKIAPSKIAKMNFANTPDISLKKNVSASSAARRNEIDKQMREREKEANERKKRREEEKNKQKEAKAAALLKAEEEKKAKLALEKARLEKAKIELKAKYDSEKKETKAKEAEKPKKAPRIVSSLNNKAALDKLAEKVNKSKQEALESQEKYLKEKEAERKKLEEAENLRIQKLEAERLRKEEEERKRLAAIEAERLKKEEEERLRKEEEERKRLAAIEAERLKKEEEERLRKEEEERLAAIEAEKKRKEEEERLKKEEEERKIRLREEEIQREKERLKREEEEERKRKEEAERKKFIFKQKRAKKEDEEEREHRLSSQQLPLGICSSGQFPVVCP